MSAHGSAFARPRRRDGGVGVVELLVAVLLLSLGLLAAAVMQVRGMHASQGAYHQSQAHFLATEMIDRMRSNVEGVELGHYDGASTSVEAENPGCAGKSCTPAELAAQDVYDWSARLHALGVSAELVPALPANAAAPPAGSVERLAAGLYRVSLSWTEVIDGVETRRTLAMNFATELS